MTREEFRKALTDATMCSIQHDGWPCGTCFFELNDSITNRDWQTVLLFRGDYKETELDNLPLPKERAGIIKKIYKMCM